MVNQNDESRDSTKPNIKSYTKCEHPLPITDITTRTGMQPMLDALQNCDYSLARALCPADQKLLGYEVLETERDITQYGSYAADYWIIRVPPGIYPIFARAYTYNEAKELYTNQIKDFNGLYFWKEGIIISSNFEKDIGKLSTVFENPYAHSIAHIIYNQKNSSIQLLPPFHAKKIFFHYNNELHHTYQIIDRSLPDYIKTNPMELENNHSSLDKLLHNAALPTRSFGLTKKETKIKQSDHRNYDI